MAKRPPINIGLLWHSAASGNLGVTALTVANMALARAAAERCGREACFTIIGPREHLPVNVSGHQRVVALDMRTLVRRDGYWSLLGSLDCLLDIGAGDSFTDIYSRRRFVMMYLTKLLAAMRGVPLLFSPQTIGPFSHQPYKRLAAQVMTSSVGVVVRDPLSAEAARALAPRARVTEAIDVAFALPYEKRATVHGGLDIGLNVSGLLFHDGHGGSSGYGLDFDYRALTRSLIEKLVARPGVRVHLICHAIAPAMATDDDAAVADALAQEFPTVIRVPNFADASAAKSYISGLDFVIAARMHACIAAFSSGVPVVPIAYSRKFTGLFEGVLGYPHIVPMRGLGTSGAVDFILEALDGRDSLRAMVAKGLAVVDDRLGVYAHELDRFFTAVAAR